MKDILLRNAMLAQLRIESWRSTIKDARISIEVAERAGADQESGNYLKRLLPRHAMSDINRIASEAKKVFYLYTMPWDDRSWRLLPVKHYEDFNNKIDELSEKRLKAKNVFLENYETYKKEAKEMLGNLYCEEDYIPADEIADKITLSKRVFPIPDSDHFIVDLAENKHAEIKQQIEEEINLKIKNTVTSLYERIKKNLDLAVKRLNTEDEYPVLFRSSLLTNLRDVADWVQELNITGDTGLQVLCEDIKEIVRDIDPDGLRKRNRKYDPEKKRIVATDIKKLQEKMNSLFPKEEEPNDED